MGITLTNDLVIFDIESTGLDKANDRIIELSLLKVQPDGKKEQRTYRFNPGGTPIKEDAKAVHGISEADLENEPEFKEKAAEVREFIGDADLAGFGIWWFDVPMLREEFLRCKINYPTHRTKIIDAGNIFKKKEERTLSAALKFYCDKELENAHSAEADTAATFEVLEAQINQYNDIGSTTQELAEFSKYEDTGVVDFDRKLTRNKDGAIIFNFGKWKGEPVEEHFDYVQWMLDQNWVTNDTKQRLKEIMGIPETEELNNDDDEDLPF